MIANFHLLQRASLVQVCSQSFLTLSLTNLLTFCDTVKALALVQTYVAKFLLQWQSLLLTSTGIEVNC